MGQILSFILEDHRAYLNDDVDDDQDEKQSNEEIVCNLHNNKELFSSSNNHKIALLIGINYDTDALKDDDLKGCENDTDRLKRFLVDEFEFEENQIKILKTKEATKKNIKKALYKILQYSNSHPNTQIFISYSGHGTFVNSNIESDGQVEALCPIDYEKNGLIYDKWIKRNFIEQLTSDSRVFTLIDCCHSGTVFDLPYAFDCKNNTCRRYEENSECSVNIVKISGCMDDQVSYDYYNSDLKKFGGALTNNFISTYHKGITFKDHLLKIRLNLLKQKFDQLPNLTLSFDKLLNYKL